MPILKKVVKKNTIQLKKSKPVLKSQGSKKTKPAKIAVMNWQREFDQHFAEFIKLFDNEVNRLTALLTQNKKQLEKLQTQNRQLKEKKNTLNKKLLSKPAAAMHRQFEKTATDLQHSDMAVQAIKTEITELNNLIKSTKNSRLTYKTTIKNIVIAQKAAIAVPAVSEETTAPAKKKTKNNKQTMPSFDLETDLNIFEPEHHHLEDEVAELDSKITESAHEPEVVLF